MCWTGSVGTMIGEAVQSANIKPCRLVRNRKRLFKNQGNLIMWVCVHTRRLHTETLPLRSIVGRSAISMEIILGQYACTEPNQSDIFGLAMLHEDRCRYCRDLWLPCPFTDPLSLRPAQVNITLRASSIAQCLSCEEHFQVALHKIACNRRSSVQIIKSSTCTCFQEKRHCRGSFSCTFGSVICRQC